MNKIVAIAHHAALYPASILADGAPDLLLRLCYRHVTPTALSLMLLSKPAFRHRDLAQDESGDLATRYELGQITTLHYVNL